MRIVTWNCCRRGYANAIQALVPVRADLVFLQEVGRPANADPFVAWAGTNPRQGVLVATVNRTLAFAAARPKASKHAPIMVRGAFSFLALNVWAQPTPSYVGHVNATLNRFRRILVGRACVIAGDFNSEGSHSAEDKPHHARLVERLRDEFGVVSAYHARHGVAHGAEAHATYFHQRHLDEPWHIDFCFVPTNWTERLVEVDVLDGEPWLTLSDHRPLVVDVDV